MRRPVAPSSGAGRLLVFTIAMNVLEATVPITHYVFIVEDHPIVRRGYTGLLANEPDLEISGMATTFGEALQKIETTSVDVVLMDISLGEKSKDGLSLTRALKARHPDLPVLVVSGLDERYAVWRALRAGADGFLSKRLAGECLGKAIRCVLEGKQYLSDDARDNL